MECAELELRALKPVNALHLIVLSLPGCEDQSARGIYLQNMLSHQQEPNVFAGRISIGRKPSCHIVLKDRTISTVHGTLQWTIEHVRCASTTDTAEECVVGAGDTLRVALHYVDSSSNGSFESVTPILKGRPHCLRPVLCGVPQTANVFDVIQDYQPSLPIYLGKPVPLDFPASFTPIYAFALCLGIAESYSMPLTQLTQDQRQALPYPGSVSQVTLLNTLKDPRLHRIKTELTRDDTLRASVGGLSDGNRNRLRDREVEGLEKQLSTAQNEIARLKTEAEKAKLSHERELRENSHTQIELKLELNLINKKLGALQQQLGTVQQERAALADENAGLAEKYERAEAKKEQLLAEIQTAEQRIHELEAEKCDMSAESGRAESHVRSLETQNRELERRVQEMEEDRLELIELRAERTKQMKEMESLRSECNKMKAEVLRYKKELNEKINSFKQSVKQIAALQRRFSQDLSSTLTSFSDMPQREYSLPSTGLPSPVLQSADPKKSPTARERSENEDEGSCSQTDNGTESGPETCQEGQKLPIDNDEVAAC